MLPGCVCPLACLPGAGSSCNHSTDGTVLLTVEQEQDPLPIKVPHTPVYWVSAMSESDRRQRWVCFTVLSASPNVSNHLHDLMDGCPAISSPQVEKHKMFFPCSSMCFRICARMFQSQRKDKQQIKNMEKKTKKITSDLTTPWQLFKMKLHICTKMVKSEKCLIFQRQVILVF